MKVTSLLLIGGAGYLAYRLFAQTTAAGQLKYFVKNVTYGDSNLGYTNLNVTLTVDNPSNENLRFNKFFCRILVNNSELANATMTDQGTPIYLKPGQTDLVIPVRVGHLSALQTLASVISQIVNKQPIQQPVTITGLLYAANLQIPITQTMTVTPQGIKGIGTIEPSKNFSTHRQNRYSTHRPQPQNFSTHRPNWRTSVIGKGGTPRVQSTIVRTDQPTYTKQHKGSPTIGNCEFCVSGVLN